MKCLVVIAHPLSNSLCHYLAQKAIRQLENKGYSVFIKNLYDESFNPALSNHERDSYYTDSFNTDCLQTDIEQLKETESLVLIFPTWWFGFPAILKGWFDRVWAPGHAFHHADNYGPIKAGLTNLKEMKVITTLGSPRWVDYLVLRQPVKRILKIALLNTCAKNCSFKMISLYKAEHVDSKRLERFVRKIEKLLT